MGGRWTHSDRDIHMASATGEGYGHGNKPGEPEQKVWVIMGNRAKAGESSSPLVQWRFPLRFIVLATGAHTSHKAGVTIEFIPVCSGVGTLSCSHRLPFYPNAFVCSKRAAQPCADRRSLWLPLHVVEAFSVVKVSKWHWNTLPTMPYIVFQTCSMKINISEGAPTS